MFYHINFICFVQEVVIFKSESERYQEFEGEALAKVVTMLPLNC